MVGTDWPGRAGEDPAHRTRRIRPPPRRSRVEGGRAARRLAPDRVFGRGEHSLTVTIEEGSPSSGCCSSGPRASPRSPAPRRPATAVKLIAAVVIDPRSLKRQTQPGRASSRFGTLSLEKAVGPRRALRRVSGRRAATAATSAWCAVVGLMGESDKGPVRYPAIWDSTSTTRPRTTTTPAPIPRTPRGCGRSRPSWGATAGSASTGARRQRPPASSSSACTRRPPARGRGLLRQGRGDARRRHGREPVVVGGSPSCRWGRGLGG